MISSGRGRGRQRYHRVHYHSRHGLWQSRRRIHSRSRSRGLGHVRRLSLNGIAISIWIRHIGRTDLVRQADRYPLPVILILQDLLPFPRTN
jgi:hypothetical protein